MNTIYIRYEGLSSAGIGDAVTGQGGTLKCKFIFDEPWDDYPIRYMIVSREGKVFDPKLISEKDEAVIPKEALTDRAHIMVGAVGLAEKNGEVLRYNGRPCRLRVDQGNLVWEPTTEEEATAYEQLLIRVIGLDEAVAEMRDALDSKLDENQGTANAGRALVVGEDGIVRPGDVSGSVEVDTTLTEEGKAADAKAVGDKFAEQSKAIDSKVATVNGKSPSNGNIIVDEAKSYVDWSYIDWTEIMSISVVQSPTGSPAPNLPSNTAYPVLVINGGIDRWYHNIFIITANGKYYNTALNLQSMTFGGVTEHISAPVASVNGKTGAVELTADDVGAIGSDKLTEAINTALTQAKESGEFKGDPGDDYVLTEADKTEIAQEAAGLVDMALLSIIGTGEVTA